jgi:hypothetical protein
LGRSILDTYFTSRLVDLPAPPPATWGSLTNRVAMVVLDGLRPMEAFNPEYMPALSRRREQAAWGIAQSGEITMTVPGVRMLGSGVSSDFLEILHNWTPRSSSVPSLFTMAKRHGLHTILCGDHVWRKAFADIDRHMDTRLDAGTYYSDPVHAPDQSHLEDLHGLLASEEPFALLVVHFVGPDHASHRHRVTSSEFRDYTRWLDPKLDELLTSLVATGTTILVTSDHGMSDSGQHGGDEPTARMTPYLLQGPGIRPGPGPILNQADLPATVAALLALPLPPFGEGRVAHQVLAAPPEAMLAIMEANLRQAQTYLGAYQKKYGNVPQPLLDAGVDIGGIASAHGLDRALASADGYLEAYHDLRRSAGKSVVRTWAWLFTILVLAVFVLLPAVRSQVPRGSVFAAVAAFVLSCASWASSAALWPSVVASLLASLWLARAALVERLSWRRGLSPASDVLAALAVMVLLALAHFGFNRQFRSDTMLPGVSAANVRAVAYAIVVAVAALYAVWRRREDSLGPALKTLQPMWIRLGIVGLFFVMIPSGKLLLLASPVLGVGVLWLYRLMRLGHAQGQLRLESFLESEWFLFVMTLAWVCLEGWFTTLAPLVDQQRGGLGWALNRLPWLVAPALAYQQLAVAAKSCSRASPLSLLSVAATLPPLLLAHHTEHSNVLVWLALVAMVLAALDLRSPLAKYRLGAATFAMTSLFGSASHALLCFVVVGTYWAFMLAPSHAEHPTSHESAATTSSIAPVLAALTAYFVWLTIHRFRDGSFSFSDIEVTVAFYGNPTHSLGQGAVQVAARFILPMVLLLIPLQRIEAWPRVFAGIIAALLLHIGVLLIGFLATETQFYTPYRLAGEIVHFLALLASVPLLFLLFAARAPLRAADWRRPGASTA